jgi:hypothetical protein
LRECGFEVIRFTMPDCSARSAWLQAYERALRRAVLRKSR